MQIRCKESGTVITAKGVDMEISEDGYVSIVCDSCNIEIYAEKLWDFLKTLGIADHFEKYEDD